MASILVVDDDELVCQVFSGYIEMAGHEATYVLDGDEALGKYREGSFAAVCLDIVMPGKGGLEVLEELLEIDGDARVIVVSGSRNSPDLLRARRLGARDVIGKPVHADAFLSTLNRVLGGAGGT